jgi:hypothetical protein
MKRLFFCLLLFLSAGAHGRLPSVQPGDIIFHTSRSAQSLAVQRATSSPYSHMGLVLWRVGRPCVFEAVATVRCTPLGEWVARGDGRHYVVKRLINAPTLLTAAALGRIASAAQRFQGKPYDLAFEWSDERLYCSELVWKIYRNALGLKIGALQKVRDFNLGDPVVAAKLRERYGERIPLDEPVISPAAMFDSPLLVTVDAQ